MRRGLWFLAGAGVGVYAMVRGRRAAEALTADGLHDRWQALGLGARLFREEVATGRAEAEGRLRERFGPTYDAQRLLSSGSGGLDTPSLVPREGYSTGERGREGYSTSERGREGHSTGERGRGGHSTGERGRGGHPTGDMNDTSNDFEEGPQ